MRHVFVAIIIVHVPSVCVRAYQLNKRWPRIYFILALPCTRLYVLCIVFDSIVVLLG